MPIGVTFDGKHSYDYFGLWLKERPDLGSPEPKTSFVDIPGADGLLDLTEANTGEVKYGNRVIVLTFAAMVNLADQQTFKSKIYNALHGKKISKIILDEDPDWYYTGRATVVFAEQNYWRLHCVVTINAEPYAMKIEETVVDLMDDDHIELNAIEIAKAEPHAYHSDFRLGTKDFPAGLPSWSTGTLGINWPLGSTTFPGYYAKINIADSEQAIDADISREDVKTSLGHAILYSDLTEAGLDISKIYRVLVLNVKNCTLVVTANSARFTIHNSRKAVMPIFELVANNAVNIIVNGVSHDIAVGAQSYDDIVFNEGDNEVYIPALGSDITTFNVKFTEGKL